MGTITVRNLDDGVQQRLRVRAAEHGRSMEAEARAILTEAVGERSFGAAWVEAMETFRAEFGGVDLELPERSMPREVDLS